MSQTLSTLPPPPRTSSHRSLHKSPQPYLPPQSRPTPYTAARRSADRPVHEIIDVRSPSRDRLPVLDVRNHKSRSAHRSPSISLLSPVNSSSTAPPPSALHNSGGGSSSVYGEVKLKDVYSVNDLYTNTNIALKSLVSHQLHNTHQLYAQHQTSMRADTSPLTCSTAGGVTLIGHADGSVRVVSNADRSTLHTIRPSTGQVYAIKQLSYSTFVAGGDAGQLIGYQFDAGNAPIQAFTHTSHQRKLTNGAVQAAAPINDIAYKPALSKQHLYCAVGNGIVEQLDISTQQTVAVYAADTVVPSQYYVKQLSAHIVCSAGNDSHIRVYDSRTSGTVRMITHKLADNHHTSYCVGMDVNDSGDWLSAAFADGNISTYHTSTLLHSHTVQHPVTPSCILYNACDDIGERLVCGSKQNGYLVHYDTHGSVASSVDSQLSGVNALCYSCSLSDHAMCAVGNSGLAMFTHPYMTPTVVDIG